MDFSRKKGEKAKTLRKITQDCLNIKNCRENLMNKQVIDTMPWFLLKTRQIVGLFVPRFCQFGKKTGFMLKLLVLSYLLGLLEFMKDYQVRTSLTLGFNSKSLRKRN